MSTESIQFNLRERFAAPLPEFYRRRIIFWKDEDREFEKDIDELKAMKESLDEVRDGVNTLLDWADNVAIEVKIPLKPAQ